MLSQVTPVALVFVLFTVFTSGIEQEAAGKLSRNSSYFPGTPRQGRFLGLLGLLTGLTLGDSLDDSEQPHFRPPGGIVKINIGRPLAESFYHYMYNPYYYGSVPSINIKIPLRPESIHEEFGVGDFVGVAGASSFGGQSGHLGLHGSNQLIEPRPILSDSSEPSEASTSNGAPKKPKKVQYIRIPKLPYSRIIRSTIRSDTTTSERMASVASINNIDQTSPITSEHEEESVLELESSPPTTSAIQTETEESLMLHATAIPVIQDNSIVDQVTELPTFLVPQSYLVHEGSLQDSSIISITTAEPYDRFKPSRPDKLQNLCGHAVLSSDEFRPVVKI
ncbi:uncharacterized protein LOC131435164 [Malaya genurostris]|uniref:uncharacterized protein LOC131435164 n=1 Tax=Malaya genurostris TaxID=325434 RepID=UPI0026F3C713|nr:uncharacterized protein LOC131435164 [Malaya genurostris]